MRRRTGDPVDLAVDALAVYRLTRLATVDTFPVAAAARERVTRWARETDRASIEELIHCPWCIGFWIATGVVLARAGLPRSWSPAARALALSAAAGVIAHHLSDEVVKLKVDPETRDEMPEVRSLGARASSD
jgi:Protein of unknown function (DUF1360)